jgi:carbon-monoxide dehydrogenase medium subunit
VKAAPFEYCAPTSLEEAVALLDVGDGDAKVLAGGQSLVPVMALRLSRFERLVDLNRIEELGRVRLREDQLVVGAMTRQSAIEVDALVRAHAPVLRKATRHIGHFQIRNRGTLGGSVAHGDPSAEYPAVVVALDATISVVGSSGGRQIAAASLYDGPMSTTLGDDEILESVAFPVWGAGSGFAVREVARREGDFATAGVVAAVTVDGGTITRAAVSLFGVGSTPVRLPALEAQLVGTGHRAADVRALGREAVVDLDPPSDIHASGSYRRRVAAELIAQALTEALEEATA